MFPPRFEPQRKTSTTTRSVSSTSVLSDEDALRAKSSLDFTQRIERKLAEYNASKNIWKRWLFEIGCWMISTTCLGSIIGIYIHINNQRFEDWDKLLTFANILGKFASAALIVPTTEALGQLKWNWFNGTSKAMWDF